MKSKVYHNYWIANSILSLVLLVVPLLAFYYKGFTHDSILILLMYLVTVGVFVVLEMYDTQCGLFTDTVYVDNEKIVINKKTFTRTIYWNQVMEIQQLNTRIGKEYCVERFGSTRKEQELTRFSCSNKFKEYMYAMFEQAKTNMRDSLQQQ